MSQVVRTRIAPSPTGDPHVGTAYIALFNLCFARQHGGQFILRIEDTDQVRSTRESEQQIFDALRWLGIEWDEGPDVGGPHAPYLQSQRGALYEEALARLVASGRVYECFLTRREVAELAASGPGVDDAGEGAQATPSRVYGPAHRALNDELAPRRRAEGRAPSLRFRVPAGRVAFEDAVQGRVEVDLAAEVGDFVVRRSDGLVAYQLAVVVDDAAMGVTEVARGADLLRSTAAQLLLYEALGLPAPAFAHVGLLLDERGEKLSKRGGALSLHELRRDGADPRAVLGLLAHTLGWLEGPEPVTAPELLAELGGRPVTAPAGPVRLAAADLARLRGVDS